MPARSPRPRSPAAPLAVAACLVGALLCGGAQPVGAQSIASASRSDQVRREARSLARAIAKPWPKRQHSDGTFVDEVGGPSSYGEAVLGFALINEGIREHDSRMVGTGLRAMRYATNRRYVYDHKTSVFQNMAVGLTYRLAQRRLRHDPRWRRIRPIVEKNMRFQKLVRLSPNPRHFGNHLLVEALEVFTFVGSGVTSSDPRTVVGPNRARTYSDARGFIQRGVPRLFAAGVRRSGGDNTILLSDPPDMPLAYQGLSIGLYAAAMGMVPPSGSAETTLRRALEASWRLVAPDGDMSYYGRNQEEAWTLAATAYGARVAEGMPGVPRSRRARYEALARRALARIRDVHLGGPGGIWVIPALRINQRLGGQAVDHGGYAPFGGLALMFLDLIADMRAPKGAKGDAVGADRNSTSILGRGESLFATQRIGPLWMAVRGAPSIQRPTDIRYDGGLVRLKRQRPDGSWADLIPTRPRLPLHGRDSAGPLLIRSHGALAGFAGHEMLARGSRGLALLGAYRTLRGSPGVARAAYEDFRPVGCGVEVSFPVQKGDRAEYSVFLRDVGDSKVGPGSVTSGGAVVASTPAARLVIERHYRSATDPEVLRARFRWTVRSSTRMRVRICIASGP